MIAIGLLTSCQMDTLTPLYGEWEATDKGPEVGGIDGPSPAIIRLTLREDGTFHAFFACNSLSGSYDATVGGEFVVQDAFRTLVGCGSTANDWELERMGWMIQADSYRIRAGRLTLLGEEGNLTFRRQD